MSEEEKKAFQEVAQEVYTQFEDKIGKELMDKVIKAASEAE